MVGATASASGAAKPSVLFEALLLPVIARVEKETDDPRRARAANQLRDGFHYIERTHPGIIHDFCVAAAQTPNQGSQTRKGFRLDPYSSTEGRITVTHDLEPHATALIGILKRIAAERTSDRALLLGTVKESAMALKAMLDTMERARPLDAAGREYFDQSRKHLMRSSKLFTDGLKEYFKGGDFSKVAACTETMAQNVGELMRRIDHVAAPTRST